MSEMTKPHIEIVVHCWAERFKHYDWALRYLLSSLVLHRTDSYFVSIALCCYARDNQVIATARYFAEEHDVSIKVVSLSVPELGRRAIGRNVAARHTDADIVWFADVDYVFGEGCLDALARMKIWMCPSDASIMYPKRYMISRDHATGDRTLEKASWYHWLVRIDPGDFVEGAYNRAIGGVQIVRGDLARKHGYLNDNGKWQQPITDGRMFHTQEDSAYRKACMEHGRQVGIDLPNVYRIRHSECAYETRDQHLKSVEK